jgi:4-hydroxybenzoate polyprenyltransferase
VNGQRLSLAFPPARHAGYTAGMSKRNPMNGIFVLSLGMVIGFSFGVIAMKQDHNVLWVIVGTIFGAVTADFFKSWVRRKSP